MLTNNGISRVGSLSYEVIMNLIRGSLEFMTAVYRGPKRIHAMHNINHPLMRYYLTRSIRCQGIFITLKKGVKKILKRIKIHFSTVVEWRGELRRTFSEPPLVSIIVPNYNHEKYLRKRLDSVYNQTYSNYEVILLDDCSSDNSRDILLEYARKYPEKTIVDFNESNGGRVFKQWNKGIKHAHGELIWIAESDDWCELNFLEKMVPEFEYESVMLAFCRSIFMREGNSVWTIEEYLNDIPSLKFDKSFIMSAHKIVRSAFAIKNIIPNVSSAMFRNTGEIPLEIISTWNDIKLCGDWLFYLYTIRGGCIAYTNETTNFYRVHDGSTSLRIQKTADYYKEQELISKFVKELYNVDDAVFEKVLDNLKAHYRRVTNSQDASIVEQNYDLNRIIESGYKRKPNVLMCCYSLQIGGGNISDSSC